MIIITRYIIPLFINFNMTIFTAVTTPPSHTLYSTAPYKPHPLTVQYNAIEPFSGLQSEDSVSIIVWVNYIRSGTAGEGRTESCEEKKGKENVSRTRETN